MREEHLDLGSMLTFWIKREICFEVRGCTLHLGSLPRVDHRKPVVRKGRVWPSADDVLKLEARAV